MQGYSLPKSSPIPLTLDFNLTWEECPVRRWILKGPKVLSSWNCQVSQSLNKVLTHHSHATAMQSQLPQPRDANLWRPKIRRLSFFTTPPPRKIDQAPSPQPPAPNGNDLGHYMTSYMSGRFMYQSGRAGDEAKKGKSPAKSGRVDITGSLTFIPSS